MEVQLIQLQLGVAVTTSDEEAEVQAVAMAELRDVSDVESQAIMPVSARKTCNPKRKMPRSLEVT